MQPSAERKSQVMEVSTVLFLLFISVIKPANGVIDYCDEHTFQTNTSFLQFTKEISDKDYAMANNFKGLHCCAKGYRSIEWYKDGMAYPWPSGVSNLILYPESANQTVYARTVSPVDSGNYTCIVRNDSHVISHSVILTILESEVEQVGYTGFPLPTHEPRDQYASRGESIRFFCEAFVGHIDLPDAKSEIRWWRGIPSGAEGADAELKMENVQELPNFPNVVNPSKYHHLHKKSHTKLRQRLHQETVPREDSQILGAYLLIHDIQTEDFGEYRCAVKNAAGEHTLQMSSWLREEDDRIRNDEVEDVTFLVHDNSLAIHIILVFLTVILFCLLLMVVLNWKFDVLHVWKNRCRRKPDGDGKEYDVCIFYESKKNTATRSITAKDTVLSHILPTSHGGYHYFTHPMHSGDSSSEKVFADVKA